MPDGTSDTRNANHSSDAPDGDVPRVGTSDATVPQPDAEHSRDAQISEPRRNPAGRSGRPSGADGLKDDGTREVRRGSQLSR